MTGQMATTCAQCGTTNDAANTFCEVCGLNFATGERPAPPPAPRPLAASAGAGPHDLAVGAARFAPGGGVPGARDPERVDPEPVDPEPIDPERVDPELGLYPPDPEAVDPESVDPEPVALAAVDVGREAPSSSPAFDPPGAADGAFSSVDGWIAVIRIDAQFFASNQAADHTGELALPTKVTVREVPLVGDDLLVGRRSSSRRITPAIDLSLEPQDSGVSHRHATLSRRGDGWSVTDLGSTNGSWVAGDPDPLEPFVAQPIEDGQSLLIGAWTRITVRRIGQGGAAGVPAGDGEASAP